METVYVCENSSVLGRAAAELGGNCRPLVCMNRRPSTTVMRLLSELRNAGATLFVNADFDWSGLRIVDQLFRELNAEVKGFSLVAAEDRVSSENAVGDVIFDMKDGSQCCKFRRSGSLLLRPLLIESKLELSDCMQ